MIGRIVTLTAVALTLSAPATSSSATISATSNIHDGLAVYITGAIQEGDYKAALAAARQVSKSGTHVDFVLDSSGGDVVEAMKIGDLVSKLHARTIIWGKDIDKEPKAASKCFSSCFLIFIAGRERMADDNYRYAGASKEKFPVLGIHRPFINPAINKRLGLSDAEAAYSRVENMVRDYMRRFGTPHDLIDSMFTIPSDEVRFVTKDEFKTRFGYERPYFDEWSKAKCGSLTPAEVQDYAAILAERIMSGNEKHAPSRVSEGYAEYLVKKNTEVRACIKGAILKHQRAVLTSEK